jgi:hypothetical protein
MKGRTVSLVLCACVVVGAQAIIAATNKATTKTTATPPGVGLGGPAPGPIIDTGGGAGDTIAYSADSTDLPATTTGYGVDKRFLKKVHAALLVDSGYATKTKKKVTGLAKGTVVTYTFSDGDSFAVTIGDSSTGTTWQCTVKGVSHALTQGADKGIPDCISTNPTTGTARTIATVTANTTPAASGDQLIIWMQK